MRLPPSLQCFIVLVALDAGLSQGHTGSSSRTGPSATTTHVRTCTSGSVNYITDRLPQQCIVSNRIAPHAHLTGSVQSANTTEVPYSTVSGQQQVTHGAPTHPSPSTSLEQSALDVTTEPPISTETSSTNLPEPSSTSVSASSSTSADSEETPLDTANFLSFEEWKKRNLEEAGQSPEHVGQQRSAEDMAKRPRPGASNALDVLGEDTEIDLDFTGFGDDTTPQQAPMKKARDGQMEQTTGKPTPEHTIRSKDAGRTCKERTNYASFDCAATIMKTNPKCKSASSVLVENKDSYMLNICSVKNKFFIVELCDDILVDTIVLANYEFFSSIFRTFRVSVSDRYPAKPDKWKELGVYEARNTRDVQPFLVEQSIIWARYLRIEILSHYGNEYYCPISLLRVHGTTMIEEFRHQEEIARGDYPEEVAEPEAAEPGTSVPGLPQEPAQSSVVADKSVVESLPAQETTTDAAAETMQDTTAQSNVSSSPTEKTEKLSQTTQSSVTSDNSMSISDETQQPVHSNTSAMAASQPVTDGSRASSSKSTEYISKPAADLSSTTQETQSTTSLSDDAPLTISTTPVLVVPPYPKATTPEASIDTTRSSTPPEATIEHTAAPAGASTSGSSSIPTSNPSPSPFPSSEQKQSSDPAPSNSTQTPPSPIVQASSNPSNPSNPSNRRSTANPPPPAPSTQESFFKSLHKRLSALESNASLSLQYIEHQSLLLRDAFLSHSKSQSGRTSTFLSTLNDTVRADLLDFRRQYDELWQGTVIELETQRRSWEREMLELRRAVEGLGQEGRGLRALVAVQSTLLLLGFGMVVFGRGAGKVAAWDNALVQLVRNGGGGGNGSPVARRMRMMGNHQSWSWTRSNRSPAPSSHQGTPVLPRSPDVEGEEGEEEDPLVETRRRTSDGGGSLSSPSSSSPDGLGIMTPKLLPLETRSSPSTPSGSRDMSVPLIVRDALVNGGLTAAGDEGDDHGA